MSTWINIAYEYTEQKEISVILGNNEPIDNNTLWIQTPDNNKTLGVSLDLYEPDNDDVLWYQVNINTEKSELLKLKNNNNGSIIIKYYNNKFFLIKNELNIIDEIELSGDKYYFYIQQKNGDLSFSVEEVVEE